MSVSKWLNSYRVHVSLSGKSVYVASFPSQEAAEFASQFAATMKEKILENFDLIKKPESRGDQ